MEGKREVSRCVKGLGLRKNIFMFSHNFLYKITRRDFPQNSCRFFISFLSRERKETKQRKETAARLKFSCVPGCSDAQPCQCLRRRERETFVFTNGTVHARLRDASEHPSTCRSFGSRQRKISNRRASLRQKLLRHRKSNWKQRPFNS